MNHNQAQIGGAKLTTVSSRKNEDRGTIRVNRVILRRGEVQGNGMENSCGIRLRPTDTSVAGRDLRDWGISGIGSGEGHREEKLAREITKTGAGGRGGGFFSYQMYPSI